MTARAAALVAAASFLSPAATRAQADVPRSALALSVGVLQDARRDASDSPIAFAGTGLGARLDYERFRAAHRFHFALAAGGSSLAPIRSIPDADIAPREDFGAYALEAGIDWRLNGASARAGEFAAGVEFASTAMLARRLYAGQQISQQDYDLITATLAPTARWTRRVGPGEAEASLSIPLIAFTDHPYTDVRLASQLMRARYASPAQFRQANGGVSYAFRPDDAVGMTASYRFGIVELNDAEPVRRVSQSFSLGVVRRFGARP